VTTRAARRESTGPDAIVARRMAPVSTEVTELPESRVRVSASVTAEEVQRRVDQAAKRLGRQLRVPGFRKGHVPPGVVIGRVGRETVLDEALRDSISSWYVDAVEEAGISTVGDPDVSLGDLPGEGEDFSFQIEVGVRPVAKLGEYKGLEVGRREPEADEEALQSQLEQLRDRAGTLETVERPAEGNDWIVMDFVGRIDGEVFDGGEGRDQLIELGSGSLVEGFEEQLTGSSAGDELDVTIEFPADYRAENLAGKTAVFEVTVKEIKAKQLPELDDDFAVDHAGFDTLEELKEDIRTHLKEADERKVEADFRESALDAAVAQATIDVPESLITARSAELWDQLSESMARQGISKEAYIQITGKDEAQILADAAPDAERALRREAVVAAIIEAEKIEPSEEELEQALEHSASHEKVSAAKLLKRLRNAGRIESLKREVASRKVVDLLVEDAKAIPVEQAKAREEIWTPDKPEAGENPSGGRLWTPGDKQT
jgi:trigger factor